MEIKHDCPKRCSECNWKYYLSFVKWSRFKNKKFVCDKCLQCKKLRNTTKDEKFHIAESSDFELLVKFRCKCATELKIMQNETRVCPTCKRKLMLKVIFKLKEVDKKSGAD